VTSGKIKHFDNLKSSFVDARNIDFWLPDGYYKEEKYADFYKRTIRFQLLFLII
jgi:hypothetical protein